MQRGEARQKHSKRDGSFKTPFDQRLTCGHELIPSRGQLPRGKGAALQEGDGLKPAPTKNRKKRRTGKSACATKENIGNSEIETGKSKMENRMAKFVGETGRTETAKFGTG